MGHFLSNRVRHQKGYQPAIETWLFGFFFSVQLGPWHTQAPIKTKKNNGRTNVLAKTSSFCFESEPVLPEGRVEHQKRNQTTTSQRPLDFVFGVRHQ